MYKLSATALHTCHSKSENVSEASCKSSPLVETEQRIHGCLAGDLWLVHTGVQGSTQGGLSQKLPRIRGHNMKQELWNEEGQGWRGALLGNEAKFRSGKRSSKWQHGTVSLPQCLWAPGLPAPAASPLGCSLPRGPLDTMINMQGLKWLAKIITQQVNWLAKLIMQWVKWVANQLTEAEERNIWQWQMAKQVTSTGGQAGWTRDVSQHRCWQDVSMATPGTAPWEESWQHSAQSAFSSTLQLPVTMSHFSLP